MLLHNFNTDGMAFKAMHITLYTYGRHTAKGIEQIKKVDEMACNKKNESKMGHEGKSQQKQRQHDNNNS